MILDAADLWTLKIALSLGLDREELEANHILEELAPSLDIFVARAEIRALFGEMIGEIAGGDDAIADGGDRSAQLFRREAVFGDGPRLLLFRLPARDERR